MSRDVKYAGTPGRRVRNGWDRAAVKMAKRRESFTSSATRPRDSQRLQPLTLQHEDKPEKLTLESIKESMYRTYHHALQSLIPQSHLILHQL